MKKCLIVLILLMHHFSAIGDEVPYSLMQVNNFSAYDDQLASAGLPTTEDLVHIKKEGYQHIINLIPGDFDKEQRQAKALKMSFAQIPVDWHNPTLQNFKDFVVLMQKYQHDKVFVHCQMNFRASTFVYLYRITQKGVAPDIAHQKLLSIWQPQPIWQKFIDRVSKHYL